MKFLKNQKFFSIMRLILVKQRGELSRMQFTIESGKFLNLKYAKKTEKIPEKLLNIRKISFKEKNERM